MHLRAEPSNKSLESNTTFTQIFPQVLKTLNLVSQHNLSSFHYQKESLVNSICMECLAVGVRIGEERSIGFLIINFHFHHVQVYNSSVKGGY